MSGLKQFFSPAAIADELAQRVIAMVTDEDRQRGVECDPNELLSWAKQWLLERLPLGSADTLESLSDELCEAFFADGGATTGDSPSAEMIAAIIKKAAELKKYSLLADDEIAILATAISVSGGDFDDPDEIAEWLKGWQSPIIFSGFDDTVDHLELLWSVRIKDTDLDGALYHPDAYHAIKNAAERDGKFNPDELQAVERAILAHADETSLQCWTWIQAQRITADDTLRSLRDGYVTACQK